MTLYTPETITLRHLDGRIANVVAGDHYVPAIFVEVERVSLQPDQVEIHSIPSLKPARDKSAFTDAVLTLEKAGYGWHRVMLYTDKFAGAPQELFNSNTKHGTGTPLKEQERYAREAYRQLKLLLQQGTFKLHITHNGAPSLEEIVE
ncbi:hypothetical protein HN587_03020 [Candidatus Woesearchaeota archaeon]|jgi:hypothetical protein|nr:hypothetical protein [Candidatus Woesearchaeota archaeon]